MAYIRKYRDKWRAEVQRHGIRATHVADTKREAQAWALRKEQELDAYKGSGGMSFLAAYTRYLNTYAAQEKPDSVDWERRRFEAMAQFFGDLTPLADFDSDLIGRWRDWRLAGDKTNKPVKSSTVIREMNLLRGLFSTAVDEWKVIQIHPFRGVRIPDDPPPRRAVWGWRQIKRVLRAKRTGKTAEMQVAFRISLHTGMRLSEVLSAKLKGQVAVAVLPKDKTTKEPVEVPLPRKGAQLLRSARFTVGANEGSTLFSELCRDLLIPGLTFHDARASALTWLSRRMDVMTLARISRHKDLRILMDTYYRETAEQIAARL